MSSGAIFLDRDGVIVEEYGYVKQIDDMPIYPFVTDCIKKIHEAGMLAIVITNQSGVARGLFSEEELIKMNNLLKETTRVDAVYYCPHHLEGIVTKYSIKCRCRKPNIGLIEIACNDFDIDLNKSFFIGDREIDIQTGKNVGIKTILVRTGYGKQEEKKDIHPDYICDDLKKALDIIVKRTARE